MTIGLVVGGKILGPTEAAAAESNHPRPVLTICIYNYAEVAQKNLTRSEKVAGEIFRGLGIDARWLDVPMNPELSQEGSANRQPADLSQLQLNLLPRTMAERFGLGDDKFGFTPGTGEDRK